MGGSFITKFDIYERCFKFAKAIVIFGDQKGLSLSHRTLIPQLIRSATSISANLMEASEAQSPRDFIGKISIALKEAKETQFWLRLLGETGQKENLEVLFLESNEIIKILAAIKRKVASKSFAG